MSGLLVDGQWLSVADVIMTASNVVTAGALLVSLAALLYTAVTVTLGR